MLRDSDEFSDEIFWNLSNQHKELRADLWRAFVDMNRDLENRGTDGVVKTHTSQDVQIYKSVNGLSSRVADLLIEKYAKPYRERFLSILNDSNISQLIMCHTMPGKATSNSFAARDTLKKRPLVSLINGGDDKGRNLEFGTFAGPEIVQHVAEIFRKVVSDLDIPKGFGEIVSLNDPFPSFHTSRPLTPEIFDGKNPFAIEVNRAFIDQNPEENIPGLREAMKTVIEDLAA